jgi:alkylhydroperoxidase/carboxymuconolactone decarboxylase family protein YurZ
MIEDVHDFLNKREQNTLRLKKETPNLFDGFNELVRHYYKSEALDKKQRELVAVACSIAQCCEP